MANEKDQELNNSEENAFTNKEFAQLVLSLATVQRREVFSFAIGLITA